MPEPLYLLKLALAGFAAGALFGVVALFVGFRLNLKKVRTVYAAAGIPETRRLYRAIALMTAGMGAVMVPMMPVLDSYGVKDPWYGLSMMAACLPFFWAYTRYLKRYRAQHSAESAGKD